MQAFTANLDGEREWKKFYNSVPMEARSRYHRLNVFFDGPEPNIDDLSSLKDLKQLAHNSITSSIQATLVKDSIYASIFYFELDDVPHFVNGNFQCQGTIFCRLTLDHQGRENLYHTLIGASSFFLVSGRPVACVESIPKGVPPFRRRVYFTAESMDEEVCILIRGITSKLRMISGLPKTL